MKKKCRECGIEFTASRDWQEFCKPEHRQAYHNREYKHAKYRVEVEMAERGINGHTNGHAPAKLDLATLGLAPKAPPIKRRKLKPDVERREERRA